MIPFLPVAWPFHVPEAKPSYAFSGGSMGIIPTMTYALGDYGSETSTDEQPEEENPWWNIVLAPSE